MRLASVGDNVVDVYPSLRLAFPGGNAVNVAVAARRAGVVATYLGAVGNDPAGSLVRDALIAEDVDVSHLRVVEGPNAYCTIEVVDGDRVFGSADIGVSRFALGSDDFEFLGGFEIAHTGDNSMCEEQVAEMAEVVPVSYDFGERPEEYWRALVPHVRVACFSGGKLSPAKAEDLARTVAALGPEFVLVTEGARGAMLLEGGRVRRAGTPVSPVDTLGAGDSLIGCFLAELVAGEDPSDALTAASRAAAATCLHNGAFGHLVRYESVDGHDRGNAHNWPHHFDPHGHPDRTAFAPARSRGGAAS